MSSVYGYIRVSSRDQNEIRQLAAMRAAGVPEKNIITDKSSGKDFNRTGYQRLKKRLKAGDLLYIECIDRLGRNYREILEQWRILTKEKEINIVVLDMPLLDTRRNRDLLGTFISDLVLQLLSYVAQNERESIRQRQAEGIEQARKRGVRFGKPTKQIPPGYAAARDKWISGKLSLSKAARECGMSRSTFYRHAGEAYKKRRSKKYTFLDD